MLCITETIFLFHREKICEVRQKEVFAFLLSTIANILATYLTNLRQVVSMKFHKSDI